MKDVNYTVHQVTRRGGRVSELLVVGEALDLKRLVVRLLHVR